MYDIWVLSWVTCSLACFQPNTYNIYIYIYYMQRIKKNRERERERSRWKEENIFSTRETEKKKNDFVYFLKKLIINDDNHNYLNII